MTLRTLQKFAWRDSVYISMKIGLNPEIHGVNESNALHMLTFDQCADHLRHEICDVLDIDKTYLASIAETPRT